MFQLDEPECGYATEHVICEYEDQGIDIDLELEQVYEFQSAMGLMSNHRGDYRQVKSKTPDDFYLTAQVKNYLILRVRQIHEEVGELLKGVEHNDIEQIADALIDIVYFVKGTSAYLGLPWEALWEVVHNANMKKVAGKTKRGSEMDAAKPDDWQPPQIKDVLNAYNSALAGCNECK